MSNTRIRRILEMCNTQMPSSKEEHTSDAVSNCSTSTSISNDDSVADPDYQMEVNTSHNSDQENVHTTPNEYQQMPENTDGILVPITTQRPIEDDDILEDIREVVTTVNILQDKTINGTVNTASNEIVQVSGRGKNRRRKVAVKRPVLSNEQKANREKKKHPIRPSCQGKCRKSCQKFTQEERNVIWDTYWSLNYTNRRKWLAKNVHLTYIKRRTTVQANNDSYKKTCSRLYFLPQNNFSLPVCRLFLLNTLGYTNDSVLTELCHAMKKQEGCAAVKENRGVHAKPTCNRELIKEHIDSLHPTVAHYRRHNAPNIRYLPRELTVQSMFQDFHSKYPNVCKKETYRKTLKDMHISLCMPISDTCDECLALEMQVKEAEAVINNDAAVKSIKEKLTLHETKATKATNKYTDDSKITDNPTTKIYSMDLQKVLLIPNMPSIKDSYFTSRLVVFNETFAALHKNPINKNYCVMWHEGIAGRNAHNIVDSVVTIIETERDTTDFVFWADNCTAQNKNWIMCTAFVILVNEERGPNSITFRYLTKGHTHMSADGIHGNIEKHLAQVRDVYDFRDIKTVVGSSRKNVTVVELNNFYEWKKKKRTAPRNKPSDPLNMVKLNSIVEIKFEKGCRSMKYRTDFDADSVTLDFLQKRFDASKRPELLPTHRGIPKKKKNDIIKVLGPLMPTSRREFWTTLRENDTVEDLNSEYGITDDED